MICLILHTVLACMPNGKLFAAAVHGCNLWTNIVTSTFMALHTSISDANACTQSVHPACIPGVNWVDTTIATTGGLCILMLLRTSMYPIHGKSAMIWLATHGFAAIAKWLYPKGMICRSWLCDSVLPSPAIISQHIRPLHSLGHVSAKMENRLPLRTSVAQATPKCARERVP